MSQVIHYNDPLRKYVNKIIGKFPREEREGFSKGHDDFEDFTPSEDMLTKGSLESLYKKATKTVRLANSIKVYVQVTLPYLLLLQTLLNSLI